MSYAAPNEINLDDKSAKILNKHLNSNVKEVKRMLREIGDFGKTNHPLFKRFKHAGMPIICGALQRTPGSGFLGDFEFFNLVPIGPDPFIDVIPIPYSKQVLDGYWIIINGLQNILKAIAENRIICIQRNLNGLIPNQRFDLSALSSQEADSMEKIVSDFYALNPPKEITISHHHNLNIKKEQILWYLSLPKFLAECKQRKEIEDKYKQ